MRSRGSSSRSSSTSPQEVGKRADWYRQFLAAICAGFSWTKPTKKALLPLITDGGRTVLQGDASNRVPGIDPSSSDMSQQPQFQATSTKPRHQISTPRMSASQMLAILREAGVPEHEAQRWIDADPSFAVDAATEE